ncbi:MAG: ABC-2 family transporter protein [Anaerolineaceae bacterium]|nr:ABC-2 family transporter protein [Anaerolineaceae bacterium]MBN2676913.1 ABC-2 family transporter protein [Anaerolineaceae bacterium]
MKLRGVLACDGMKVMGGNMVSSDISALVGLSLNVFRNLKAYTPNAILRLVQYPIKLLILVVVWKVIYAYGGTNLQESIGMNYSQIVSYYIIAGLIAQMFSFYQITREVESDIRQDVMALYLCKPFNYWIKPASNLLVSALTYWILMLPLLLLVLFVFIGNSLSWLSMIQFFCTLFLGIIIQFLIWFMVGLSAFWTEQTQGLQNIIAWVQNFLNGTLLPLNLFPPLLRAISLALPFQIFVYSPTQALLGLQSAEEFLHQIILALAWIFVLAIMNYFLWRRALRVYSSQGG